MDGHTSTKDVLTVQPGNNCRTLVKDSVICSMKTELQKALAVIAPCVDLHTIWSRDHTDKFHDSINKDWTAGKQAKDWKCWQAEIRASIVKDGELISASEYMGGTWERTGDRPHISNPTINGYEPQMTEEALEELLAICGKRHPAAPQIHAAIHHVRKIIEANYAKQRKAQTTS